MGEKKIPIAVQTAFALAAGKNDEAHDIIGHALADMIGSACRFAQNYPYEDLPFVVASMKVATNALESVLDEQGKALADNVFQHTDSIVINASEFMRQAKGGDCND